MAAGTYGVICLGVTDDSQIFAIAIVALGEAANGFCFNSRISNKKNETR